MTSLRTQAACYAAIARESGALHSLAYIAGYSEQTLQSLEAEIKFILGEVEFARGRTLDFDARPSLRGVLKVIRNALDVTAQRAFEQEQGNAN